MEILYARLMTRSEFFTMITFLKKKKMAKKRSMGMVNMRMENRTSLFTGYWFSGSSKL